MDIAGLSLQEEVYTAYANRDFKKTVQLLTQLIGGDSQNPRWYEMRAQVRFGSIF
jgi:hypothetical protein